MDWMSRRAVGLKSCEVSIQDKNDGGTRIEAINSIQWDEDQLNASLM